jgi:predicted sugar kinase
MHAAKIMQQALGVEHGLHIDIEDEVDLRHCGLGSSSSLMAGTAASVNELYGRPISPLNISRFCAQNHGEEIEGNDNRLVPVQCIGGSAVCGHFEGGLVILAGQATPIYTLQLPLDKKVVIGVPSDFTHPDSEELMKAEIDNIAGFQSTGEVYGKKIAYRLVHEVLPGLVEGNLKPCKDLVFDYRWDMGSIGNCEFVYPGLTSLAEKMRWMKDDEDIDIISLSSVGPGFFAITPYSEKISEAFKSLGMQTITTGINNGKYSVEYGETI